MMIVADKDITLELSGTRSFSFRQREQCTNVSFQVATSHLPWWFHACFLTDQGRNSKYCGRKFVTKIVSFRHSKPPRPSLLFLALFEPLSRFRTLWLNGAQAHRTIRFLTEELLTNSKSPNFSTGIPNTVQKCRHRSGSGEVVEGDDRAFCLFGKTFSCTTQILLQQLHARSDNRFLNSKAERSSLWSKIRFWERYFSLTSPNISGWSRAF